MRVVEVSKFLKGVDGIVFYLVKIVVVSNVIVFEVLNVGEYYFSYFYINFVWGVIFGGKRNEKFFLILIICLCDL